MMRPRRVTDEEIKAAAREVFIERGPSAPVSMIAERLGISHAALFGRAGTKQNLMLEALCPGLPRALAELGEGPPAQGELERLCAILEDLMEFFHRTVPNLVVLRAAGLSLDELFSSPDPPPPIALRRALAAWLKAAKRAREADAEAIAEGLIGAMEARCFHTYLGGASREGGDGAFVRALVLGLLEGRGEDQ